MNGELVAQREAASSTKLLRVHVSHKARLPRCEYEQVLSARIARLSLFALENLVSLTQIIFHELDEASKPSALSARRWMSSSPRLRQRRWDATCLFSAPSTLLWEVGPSTTPRNPC